MTGRIRRHWKGLTVSAIALAAVLIVGVPYVYIHFIEGDQPAPLSLSDLSTSVTGAGEPDQTRGATNDHGAATSDQGGSATGGASESAGAGSGTTESGTIGSGATGGIDGTWTIGSGSQAGYRVHETLAGQDTEAVGRTDAVTGSLTVTDQAMTAAEITVQVAEIASDNGQRDRQFSGRIMNADQYPTATFTLTAPIALDTLPAGDASVALSATGDLTLHGTTKQVTFPITVQRTDAGLAATGTIDITYQDYGINNPSISGFVSVGDSGTIEFLLVAARS